MPDGIVHSITKSKKGTPIVNVSGQDYYAPKVDLSGIGIGDKISFDSNSSDYRGSTYWYLNGYKVLVKATGPGPLVTPAPQSIAAPTLAQQGLNAPLTEGERLTVSNWVAAAIQAGHIKDRADLGIWAKAACEAIRFAGKPVDPNDIT